MELVRREIDKPAICELEYVFTNPIPLRTVCVQSEDLPNEVCIEVYGSDGTLLQSVTKRKDIDYFSVPGHLTNAAWEYEYIPGTNMLEVNCKKIKVLLTMTDDEDSFCRIYNISASDGTESFIPAAGGDMYGELNCHDGLCLYDESGNKYKLTIGTDEALSIVKI
jgi:hypothetical protein